MWLSGEWLRPASPLPPPPHLLRNTSSPPPPPRSPSTPLLSFPGSPPPRPGQIRAPRCPELSQHEHTGQHPNAGTERGRHRCPSPSAPHQRAHLPGLRHRGLSWPGFARVEMESYCVSSFESFCSMTSWDAQPLRTAAERCTDAPSTASSSLHWLWILGSFPVWGCLSAAAQNIPAHVLWCTDVHILLAVCPRVELWSLGHTDFGFFILS